MTYEVQIGQQVRKVDLVRQPDGGWHIALDGHALDADVVVVDAHTLSLIVAGRSYTFAWELGEKSVAASTYWLGSSGCETSAEVRDPRRLVTQRRLDQTGRASLRAPMAGKVVRLMAAVGDSVERGQGLVVLEAMKMQNEVRSPKTGTLIALPVAPGATVATGQLLAEVE